MPDRLLTSPTVSSRQHVPQPAGSAFSRRVAVRKASVIKLSIADWCLPATSCCMRGHSRNAPNAVAQCLPSCQQPAVQMQQKPPEPPKRPLAQGPAAQGRERCGAWAWTGFRQTAGSRAAVGEMKCRRNDTDAADCLQGLERSHVSDGATRSDIVCRLRADRLNGHFSLLSLFLSRSFRCLMRMDCITASFVCLSRLGRGNGHAEGAAAPCVRRVSFLAPCGERVLGGCRTVAAPRGAFQGTLRARATGRGTNVGCGSVSVIAACAAHAVRLMSAAEAVSVPGAVVSRLL